MTLRGFLTSLKVSRWRYALLVFLCAGLLMGPISSSDAAGSSLKHSHSHSLSSDHGNSGSVPPDNNGHDHSLTHCGVSFCAPSFAGALASTGFNDLSEASRHQYVTDDPLLRSLYLDGDPPVPKS